IRPGIVNRPLPRRLFLITPLSDSNTAATCLRDKLVSLEICIRTSDLVGAPPFFAICRYSSNVVSSRAALPRSVIAAKNSTRDSFRKPFLALSVREMPFFSVFAHQAQLSTCFATALMSAVESLWIPRNCLKFQHFARFRLRCVCDEADE